MPRYAPSRLSANSRSIRRASVAALSALVFVFGGSLGGLSVCSSSSDKARRRSSIPRFSLGINSSTLAAISDFHAPSNRMVASSRCLARKFNRAVPISGLSSVTRGSPRLTFWLNKAWTSRTMPAARGLTSTLRSELI